MAKSDPRFGDGPPIFLRWGYYLFGFRVPSEWLEWAERDIGGRFWVLRELLRTVIFWPLYLIVLSRLFGLPKEALFALPVVLAASLYFHSRSLGGLRRARLAYQRGEITTADRRYIVGFLACLGGTVLLVELNKRLGFPTPFAAIVLSVEFVLMLVGGRWLWRAFQPLNSSRSEAIN